MAGQAKNEQLNTVRVIPAPSSIGNTTGIPDTSSLQAPAASKKGMIDALLREAVVKLSQELGAAGLGEHVKRVNMTA